MSVSESEVILHIGVPKTGTTALQAYLYENRDFLRRHCDVIYPETLLENFDLVDQYAHHLYAHKWGGWLDASKFQTPPDEAWKRLGERICHEPGRYVVSSERFADVIASPKGQSVLEYIRDCVKPAKLCVLGYVRRQDILADSFLRQTIKVGLFNGEVSSYVARLPSFFDFDQLFSTAASVVGWENILIRSYAKDRLRSGSVIFDFVDLLGIQNAPNPAPQTAGDPSNNESINSLTAVAFLQLKDHRVGDEAMRTVHALRDYFGRSEFQEYDPYYALGTDARRQIIDRYSESNLALADKLMRPHSLDDLRPQSKELPPSVTELWPANEIAKIAESVLSGTPIVGGDWKRRRQSPRGGAWRFRFISRLLSALYFRLQ